MPTNYNDLFRLLNPQTGLPNGRSTPGAGGGLGGSYAPAAGLNLTPNAPTVTGQNPLGGSTVAGGVGGATSGGGGTGGYDVKSLLESLLNPIQANLTAQGQYDLAGRNNAINRALIQFGSVPDTGQAQQQLGLNLGEIVAPDTARLAQENPFSATKQLSQQHSDAVRQIRRSLAARGALQSGELGYQLNRENQQYGQANYNANQQLLDFIAAAQQGYADAERQRKAQEAQAGTGAVQQLLSLFPNGLPTGGGAPAAPAAPAAAPQLPAAAPAVAPTGGYSSGAPTVGGTGGVAGEALKRLLGGQLQRRALY